MVRHKAPDSPQTSEEAAQENFNTAHPLNRHRSQTAALLEQALQRKDVEDFKIKEVAEWKACVNAVASTPNGRMFIRSMLQHSGLLDVPALHNTGKMVTNTIKAAFYLTWVRPYLDVDVRRDLE